jgi:predicted membrane chloride channel (bestrophin family)
MERIKKILLVINSKSLIITALSILSTYLCRRYGWNAEFPLTLITIAIIFPVVFSISGAYKRREAALDDYGAIKAHGRAIYYATRDWLANPESELTEEIRDLLGDLLNSCRTMFMRPVSEMEKNERVVYSYFSKISFFIKKLREKGLASGEASRCNQFLSKMMISFENVKHIYQYRTPNSLRAYSDFFIVILPILYGPYFAEISKDYSEGLIYVVPALFSIILVSLDNIQAQLEDPFDQIGEDDVTIHVEKFVSELEL